VARRAGRAERRTHADTDSGLSLGKLSERTPVADKRQWARTAKRWTSSWEQRKCQEQLRRGHIKSNTAQVKTPVTLLKYPVDIFAAVVITSTGLIKQISLRFRKSKDTWYGGTVLCILTR
jgi:hypothetical protein